MKIRDMVEKTRKIEKGEIEKVGGWWWYMPTNKGTDDAIRVMPAVQALADDPQAWFSGSVTENNTDDADMAMMEEIVEEFLGLECGSVVAAA